MIQCLCSIDAFVQDIFPVKGIFYQYKNDTIVVHLALQYVAPAWGGVI